MRASIVLTVAASIGFSLAAGLIEPVPAAVFQKPTAEKNPIPMSAASINAGRLVYAKDCRSCHGLFGKGDGVAPPPGVKPANLVAGIWKHGGSDAEIFKTIKEGISPDYSMQAWDGKISDTDIWNTINYLRDLAAKLPKTPPAKAPRARR